MVKIKYRQKIITPEQQVQIVSDYRSGIIVKDIAKRNKCHVSSVYRILKKKINNE